MKLPTKFILAMTCVFAATILTYLKSISDGVYSTIIVAAMGGFFAAEVVQKRAVTVAEGIAMKRAMAETEQFTLPKKENDE